MGGGGTGTICSGGGTGRIWAGPLEIVDLSLEVVVLLDETSQLGLDEVEERVHLVFIVSALTYRRFLEGDVMDVGWGQGHRITSGRRDTGQRTCRWDVMEAESASRPSGGARLAPRQAQQDEHHEQQNHEAQVDAEVTQAQRGDQPA
jgi:hypothetical protein